MFIFKKESSRESRFLYEMKNYFFIIVIAEKKYYNVCGGKCPFNILKMEKETKKVIGKYYHQFAKRCRRV